MASPTRRRGRDSRSSEGGQRGRQAVRCPGEGAWPERPSARFLKAAVAAVAAIGGRSLVGSPRVSAAPTVRCDAALYQACWDEVTDGFQLDFAKCARKKHDQIDFCYDKVNRQLLKKLEKCEPYKCLAGTQCSNGVCCRADQFGCDNGVCIVCPPPRSFYPEACECECAPQTCAPGQALDANTCECDCLDGYTWCDGRCIPPGACCSNADSATPAGMHLRRLQTKPCPSGTSCCGGDCLEECPSAPPACPAPASASATLGVARPARYPTTSCAGATACRATGAVAKCASPRTRACTDADCRGGKTCQDGRCACPGTTQDCNGECCANCCDGVVCCDAPETCCEGVCCTAEACCAEAGFCCGGGHCCGFDKCCDDDQPCCGDRSPARGLLRRRRLRRVQHLRQPNMCPMHGLLRRCLPRGLPGRRNPQPDHVRVRVPAGNQALRGAMHTRRCLLLALGLRQWNWKLPLRQPWFGQRRLHLRSNFYWFCKQDCDCSAYRDTRGRP